MKTFRWWTIDELAYMCYFRDFNTSREVGLAIDRTVAAVRLKHHKLKRRGEFDFYYNLGKKKYGV